MKLHSRLAASLTLAVLMLAPFAVAVEARQQTDEPLVESRPKKQDAQAMRERRATKTADEAKNDNEGVKGEGEAAPVTNDAQATTRIAGEGPDEDTDAEEVTGLGPGYGNFLTSYRLGPEDVISVIVFGLDRYSKTGIVIPPDGRIDYFFIPEGMRVAGKTTRQVASEITARLEEYIIDPKVTVSLERAMSARFGVIGDVARPGIMVMSRRMSVYEALNEAGGVLPTGDKKKVVVLRWNADRVMERQVIDVAAIERGRLADNYFLQPGDQVFVPGNRYKTVKEVLNFLPIISFARIFTGGF